MLSFYLYHSCSMECLCSPKAHPLMRVFFYKSRDRTSVSVSPNYHPCALVSTRVVLETYPKSQEQQKPLCFLFFATKNRNQIWSSQGFLMHLDTVIYCMKVLHYTKDTKGHQAVWNGKTIATLKNNAKDQWLLILDDIVYELYDFDEKNSGNESVKQNNTVLMHGYWQTRIMASTMGNYIPSDNNNEKRRNTGWCLRSFLPTMMVCSTVGCIASLLHHCNLLLVYHLRGAPLPLLWWGCVVAFWLSRSYEIRSVYVWMHNQKHIIVGNQQTGILRSSRVFTCQHCWLFPYFTS